MKKLFDEYYVGRRGLYHNKNVVILSTNYDVLTYQDFGFKFEEFIIELYYEDDKKTEKLKGNSILKNLKLYEGKKI